MVERWIDPASLRFYKRTGFLLLLIPFVATTGYATTTAKHGGAVGAMGGALLALAPFVVGALVGFLFGIPRTLTGEAPPTPEGSKQPATRHAVNTNLEQISDWLTKILVGVGLTQLESIPDRFVSLSTYFAPALGDRPDVVTVVVVYFLAAGFLGFYLFTRLLLAPAFEDADNGPNPSAVGRLSDPAPPSGEGRARIDPRDVGEILRYRFADMKSRDEKLAWVRAKLDNEQLDEAVPAAREIAQEYEHDPRAIEGLLLALLYDVDRPGNADEAIQVARSYLDGRGDHARDARVWALLSLALGQAYWTADASKRKDLTEQALAAVRKAIELDPSLKGYLRYFTSADRDDDDLAELAATSSALRKLLELE